MDPMLQGGDVALPYIEKQDKLTKMQFRDFSVIGPAGSMNSNVNDLLRWVQIQLSGGSFEKMALLSPTTLQEIHRQQIAISNAIELEECLLNAYGIGWKICSYRGQYFLSHDGGLDGFTSVISLLPKYRIGIVILANRNLSALPCLLSLQAIDRVLELPPIDWLQKGIDAMMKGKVSLEENKKQEDVSRKKGTHPSHPLTDFIGKYHHSGYGTLSVECVGGRLKATLHGLSSWLDHWHYDVFVMSEEMQDVYFSRAGTKVSFRTNLRGNIDEIVIPLEATASDIVFTRACDETRSSLDDLRRFTGFYEIYGLTVEVTIRNQALCAIIPGQPVYQLLPTSAENEFTVKTMAGYSVRFILDPHGKVEELLLVQPYGASTAKPKR